MTCKKYVESLRKIADVIERESASFSEDHFFKDFPLADRPDVVFGAAFFYWYFKTLVAESDKRFYLKDRLIQLLDLVAKDPEIFPPAFMKQIAELEKDDQKRQGG